MAAIEYVDPGSAWLERAVNGYIVHYTMCSKPEYAGPYDNVMYNYKEEVFGLTGKDRNNALDRLDALSGGNEEEGE